MLLSKTLHFFALLLLLAQTHCRLISQISSFTKELTFHDGGIHLSNTQNVVTENESFLYAICSSQEKTFKENHCNVTIETPAFVNATYRKTCDVKIIPDNVKLESLHKLQIYIFDDDRALLTWMVKDPNFRTKVSKVRILQFSDCKFQDLSVPAEKILSVVSYDTTFDVIVTDKKYCDSDNCRVTYNVQGEKLAGPVQFLQNFKFSLLTSVVPVQPYTSSKGFYVLVYSTHEQCHVLQVNSDGKATELLKIDDPIYVRMSNSRDLFGVCWADDKTNVTCKQYDLPKPHVKMVVKTNSVVEFRDEPSTGSIRWLQPHNLPEGGFVLVTGQSNNSKKYESFSVVKINKNGHHERPLEIDGLDFECTNSLRFFVNVAENDSNELCVYFVCDRQDFDHNGTRNNLKFSTKCFHKSEVSMLKYKAAIN